MPSPSPTVSVVIPVYNRPEVGLAAIRSVQSQTFSDLEIVVVDDGSTSAFEIPQEVATDTRLKILRHESNRGPSAARNTGARAARGRWLAWLDSDDVWHPRKLELQLAAIEQFGTHRETTAFATGFEYLHRDGRSDRRIPIAADDPLLFFSACWFCPGSAIMLSKAMFECVGGYDEGLRRLEDIDWFARFAMVGGRLQVVDDVLVTVHVGQKVSYDRVRTAGELLRSRLAIAAEKCGRGADRRLAAYLELEYASSALKRDGNLLLGLQHLAASWLLWPRTTMHLYRYWTKAVGALDGNAIVPNLSKAQGEL